MGNISRAVQTGAMGREPRGEATARPNLPPGGKRYVTGEGKFHAIVIHPLPDDPEDAALCERALKALGGDAIKFRDSVFMSDHPDVIAYLDSRINKGLFPTVAEDASADVMALAAAAGIEIKGTIRATKKASGE